MQPKYRLYHRSNRAGGTFYAEVLAFMETRLTNAAMEAINGVIQLAKRMARGFRNIKYFRLAAYLKAGGLKIGVPHVLHA